MTRQFTYSFRPRVSIYEGSSPNRGFAPVLLNHQQRAQSSTNPSKSSQFTTQFNAEKSRSARLTPLQLPTYLSITAVKDLRRGLLPVEPQPQVDNVGVQRTSPSTAFPIFEMRSNVSYVLRFLLGRAPEPEHLEPF